MCRYQADNKGMFVVCNVKVLQLLVNSDEALHSRGCVACCQPRHMYVDKQCIIWMSEPA